MIKILQICSSLDGTGGVQSMLKSYYSHMDKENIQFDFIVHGDEKGEMEEWFEKSGSHIFHVPPRHVSFNNNVRAIKDVLKNNDYDIVHCHQDYHGALSLALAKHYGIGVRIAHCHQANPPEGKIGKLRRYINTLLLMHVATDFWACGIKAAEWCYGKGSVENGLALVIPNAIEMERYRFSVEKRKQVRKELGVENKTVIGHVGRFTNQKNHKLLLEIFQKFHQNNPESALLLVGDGELKETIAECIKLMKLEDCVLLLGARDDVPELLNGFDVFVLPSRFEGLCIVAIESQANSLPMICSQNVTDEICISDNVYVVPLSQYNDLSAWCDLMNKALDKGRIDSFDAVCSAGYNIREEAIKLERKYKECNERERKRVTAKNQSGGGIRVLEYCMFCPHWKMVEEYNLL